MAIQLDWGSVKKALGESDHCMVFGYQHCRYTQVYEALQTSASPMKKVFDCSVGYPLSPTSAVTTLDSGRIPQIKLEPITNDLDPVVELKRYCKAALVNLLMKNLERQKRGLPPIVVIFCVDIDNNPHETGLISPKDVAAKGDCRVTLSEMRRAAKLANIKGLEEVAEATFVFIKLKEVNKESRTFAFERITPPWKRDGWGEAWNARMLLSNPAPKKNPWRPQLKAQAASLGIEIEFRPTETLEGKRKESKKRKTLSKE